MIPEPLPDEDSLPSLDQERGQQPRVVIAIQTPDGDVLPLRDPTDEDLIAVLRSWCMRLDLVEAASFLRHHTKRLPPPAPRGGSPVWLEFPDADGVMPRVQRNPGLVAVIRTLERERFSTSGWEVYSKLAQIVERDLWP